MATPNGDNSNDDDDDDDDDGAQAAVAFDRPRGVVLCLLCGVGVGAAAAHFRNRHRFTGARLQRVLARCGSVEGGARDPATVALPADGGAAVEGLARLAGYACARDGCAYRTVNYNNMRHHARKAPHADAADGRTSPGWTRVTLQSYTPGRHARYWIVAADDDDDDDDNDDDDEEKQDGEGSGEPGDGWEQMLAAYSTQLAAEEAAQRRVAEAPAGLDGDSVWVREMGWARHLAGKDLVALYEASAGPVSRAVRAKLRDRGARAEQARLARLAGAFDGEVARSLERVAWVPHETLRWLESIDPSKPAGRPFRAKEHADTMTRYRGYWQRYLCYCVRAHGLGRQEAEAQRGVRFADRQWDALADVVDALEEEEEKEEEDDAADGEGRDARGLLGRAVFQFCVYSLQQKLGGRIFESPLLHFAAVLGIDVERRAWRAAKNYTNQLAGLLWCGRVLLLEAAFEGQPDDAEAVDVDAVEHFKQEHRAWLADGSHTPVSTIVRWMAYGKGFRRQEGGTSAVRWETGPEKEILYYFGQRIRLGAFRQGACAVVDEAEALLGELCFGGWGALAASLDLARVVDTVMFEGAGRSFATHEANRWLRPGHARLAELARAALWDGKRRRWRNGPVREWLGRLQAFRRAHLVNTHVWGGQPGRGPEIMTLRHGDTQQLLRNVFVLDGEVMLVTDRDKNKAIRGIGRKVARFLPARLGKMMVAGRRRRSPRYSGGTGGWGAWQTAELSKQLVRVTGQHVGVELSVADYRHVAIELGRTVRGLVVRQLEVDLAGDDDRGGDGATVEDAATGEARKGARFESVWDLQATHGSAVARQHYAVDVRFPNQLQPQMVANFREISRLWHRYLEHGNNGVDFHGKNGVDSHGGHGEEAPKKRRRSTHEQADEDPITATTPAAKRSEPTPDPAAERRQQKADGALKTLLGNGARWRSAEQEDAARRVLALKGNAVLIVVLPTGAGKSVLFLLPAVPAMHAGVSLVVVPFTALINDLVRRATDAGLDCLHWQPAEVEGRDEQARVARLVVVSADVATSSEFLAYADSLRARRLLRRIFVDECHTVLMDAAYRPRLEELRELHRFDCPVVLLTATLPVRLERAFRQAMLAEEAAIVRAPTTKRNIRYRVTTVTPGPTAVEDEVVRTVIRLQRRWRDDEKGVIYCRTQQACEALADKVGCAFYHSGVDEATRQARLEAWIQRKADNHWIAATTGLGTGVDVQGIVAVVHAGLPYGLVDFAQQTGRGGRREGETVDSVVVWDGRAAWQAPQSSDVEQLNRQAMTWFVQSVDCRRVGLGTFLDGQGLDCAGVRGDACDRCERQGQGPGQGPGLSLSEGRLQRWYRQKYEADRVLQRWLDEAWCTGAEGEGVAGARCPWIDTVLPVAMLVGTSQSLQRLSEIYGFHVVDVGLFAVLVLVVMVVLVLVVLVLVVLVVLVLVVLVVVVLVALG
ncbi:uncharacterized protein PG986_011483 [Apiospora aurea]|uniref:DNA 3'-5' helicase n=1 Tax=Apiospora aurea TaxID=335848 RepID=A0ABR1Q584_9PEZI